MTRSTRSTTNNSSLNQPTLHQLLQAKTETQNKSKLKPQSSSSSLSSLVSPNDDDLSPPSPSQPSSSSSTNGPHIPPTRSRVKNVYHRPSSSLASSAPLSATTSSHSSSSSSPSLSNNSGPGSGLRVGANSGGRGYGYGKGTARSFRGSRNGSLSSSTPSSSPHSPLSQPSSRRSSVVSGSGSGTSNSNGSLHSGSRRGSQVQAGSGNNRRRFGSTAIMITDEEEELWKEVIGEEVLEREMLPSSSPGHGGGSDGLGIGIGGKRPKVGGSIMGMGRGRPKSSLSSSLVTTPPTSPLTDGGGNKKRKREVGDEEEEEVTEMDMDFSLDLSEGEEEFTPGDDPESDDDTKTKRGIEASIKNNESHIVRGNSGGTSYTRKGSKSNPSSSLSSLTSTPSVSALSASSSSLTDLEGESEDGISPSSPLITTSSDLDSDHDDQPPSSPLTKSRIPKTTFSKFTPANTKSMLHQLHLDFTTSQTPSPYVTCKICGMSYRRGNGGKKVLGGGGNFGRKGKGKGMGGDGEEAEVDEEEMHKGFHKKVLAGLSWPCVSSSSSILPSFSSSSSISTSSNSGETILQDHIPLRLLSERSIDELIRATSSGRRKKKKVTKKKDGKRMKKKRKLGREGDDNNEGGNEEEEGNGVESNYEEEEEEMGREEEEEGRIVVVEGEGRNKGVRNRLSTLHSLISTSLSSSPLPPDQLKSSKSFLLVLPKRKKVVACVIACRVEECFRVLGGEEMEMAEKGKAKTGGAAIIRVGEEGEEEEEQGLEDVTKDGSKGDENGYGMRKTKKRKKTGLVCSSTPSPCLLGILRLFVSPSHRRRGLATLLLDAVAEHYIYGFPIKTVEERKRYIAWSQPTGSGEKVARKWFGEGEDGITGREGGWGVFAD